MFGSGDNDDDERSDDTEIRVSEREWSLYFGSGFSDRNGSADSPELEAVAHICRRLRPLVTRESVRDSRIVPLNFEQLISHVGSTFRTLFVDHPATAMPCLALAVHKLLAAEDSESSEEQLDVSNKVTVRLYEFEPQTPLTQLKSNLLGKMVCIKGSVIRAGFIRPMITAVPFVCRKCSTPTAQAVPCVDGIFPEYRGTCHECEGRTFAPMREEATMDDFQIIRIQEELDNESGAGRVPRTIDCELLGDLVDSCVPGDQVTVVGVLRMRVADDYRQTNKAAARRGRGRGRGGSQRGGGGDAEANAPLDVYIQVNSIDNKKQVDTGRRETMIFSEKDLEAVRYIHEQPKLFSLLVNSIAPAIFGHDLVKAGLTLALFGGTQNDGGDDSTPMEKMRRKERGFLPVRGDSHILIVGDPGMGKSQMLQAVNTISPRGVYVCGTYSSSRGLTVTLNREAGTSDYALEAGALVLGDQGVCLLDEFDKMDISEHQSLLEAMEQQSISIAKAGVVCSLPARTCVIAAANPVGGHYKFVLNTFNILFCFTNTFFFFLVCVE